MTGGADADRFVFRSFASQGADTITDFARGSDQLQICKDSAAV